MPRRNDGRPRSVDLPRYIAIGYDRNEAEVARVVSWTEADHLRALHDLSTEFDMIGEVLP